MIKKSFSDLKETIIDRELCTRCGACVASCPSNALRYGGNSIEIIGDCTSCGVCSRVCPGGGMDLSQKEKELFGRSRKRPVGRRLGIYKSKTQLTSSSREFIKAGYFGGRITSVLVAALESGMIDAALMTDWNREGYLSIGSARIAKTKQEVISMASSKYVFSPVLTLLKDIEKNDDITKAALVGLPCNIQGFRKMQSVPTTSGLTRKIEYVIGLNCGAPQMEEATWKGLIAGITGIPAEEISAVRYRKVSSRILRLEVDRRNGENYVRTMGIARLLGPIARSQHWLRCRMCPDYSSELSDITFGAPVIRTEKGEELLRNALDKGYLRKSSFKKIWVQNLQDVLIPYRKRRWTRKNVSKRKRNGMGIPRYR
jgi:coenzyme F420 hydrogenase subunit beta